MTCIHLANMNFWIVRKIIIFCIFILKWRNVKFVLLTLLILRLQGWNASRKITSIKNCISANKMQYCKHVGWGNFSNDDLMIIISFYNRANCCKWCIKKWYFLWWEADLITCRLSFKEEYAWFTTLPGCNPSPKQDSRMREIFLISFWKFIIFDLGFFINLSEVSRKWSKYF